MIITKRRTSLALLIASAMMVTACGDDGKDGQNGADGSNGDNGENGQPGTSGLHIDMAAEATANITNAAYADGIITVDFDLANKEGVGLFGLTGDNEFHDFRFSLAQLQTNTGSELKQWMSLLNETTNDAGTTFEQGFEKLNDCPECLVDHNDGTYTYTFNTNLTTAEDVAGIVFDAGLTQRIAIEMQFEYDSGHELAENAHYDWIPSTNAQEGIGTRDLVTLETCYTCHQPDSLKAHGGRRLDLENCQSCHNGVVSDPNDVSVELGHMVHAIHMGPNREGKNAEGNVVPMPYTIAGYGGDHAFDYPAFPTKPFMDCAACHVEDENLADKELWLANANANACTGCHTDSPAQHKSDKNPSLTCTDCHSAAVHSDHKKPYDAAQDYSVEVSNLVLNVDGLLEFDVKVMDSAGALVTEDEIYKQGYSNPYMVVSWDIEDDYPEQLVSSETDSLTVGTTYDHRRFSLKGDGSTTYDADTKVFHVITEKVKGSKTYRTDVPADILTDRSLEILPLVKVCFTEATNVRTDCTADDAYPAYVQTEPYRVYKAGAYGPEMRRPIIDEATCMGCHSQELYHDANGVNCIACHTNDKKLGAVEVDYAPVPWGQMKSSSFMYKAHKAQGHDNGHGGSGTILKTDCMTCHAEVDGWSGKDYGFELGRNAGSAHTVPSFIASEGNTDPVLTYYASPDAAACMSCHQKYLSDAAMSHFESNGAYFGPDKQMAKDAKEACATCHSPEKIMEHHGHSL